MASDVQTKILDIQVRYESAVNALGKYRKEIEDTRQAMKTLSEMHKSGQISTEEYHRSMAAADQQLRFSQQASNVLTRQIQTQNKANQEQVGSLNQLRAQLSEATRAYDAMSRSERESAAGEELKKKIVGITTELKEAEGETLRFYRNVGNYPEAVDGLGKVESKVKDLTKAFLAVAGITGFKSFTDQVKQAGTTFDDQMAKVQSITNATTVEFIMMRREAERLGSTTRYTATEAAEALENLTRNGLSAANATSVLAGTLQLAQANKIELAEAADIVTNQLNAFHLSVDQVNRVGDVMSAVCAKSATDIKLLADGLKNTAPLSYTLGISLEETNAALAILANNGIKGADAGTVMKQALTGLVATSPQGLQAMQKWNLSIDENTIKEEGLIATLKRLNDSGIMESNTKMQDLADIFGSRAAGSVMALLNSIEDLDAFMTDNLGVNGVNAADTVARMFEQSFSDYTVAADSLKSAWEGLLISIWHGDSKKIEGEILARAQAIDDAYEQEKAAIEARFGQSEEGLAKLEEAKTQYEQQKAELAADAEAMMAEASGGMAESLTGPLQMITDIVAYCRENLNELATMIAAVIGGISLTALIKMVKTSVTTMKSDIITNAETATKRVNDLQKQRGLQTQQMCRLETQYERASGAEKELIANKLTVQKKQLAETEKALAKAKTAEITAMENAAAVSTATGWKGAMQTAGIAVKGFITTAKTAFKGFIITAVISLCFELVMKLWDAFNSGEGVIGRIGGAIKSFIGGALNKLKEVIVDVINWFIEFYNDSILVRGVVATIGTVFKAVWAILKAGIASIGNSFKLLGDIISGVARALKGLFTLHWGDAVEGVKDLGRAVTNFYKNQKDVAVNTAKEIRDDVLDSFANMDTKLEKVTLNKPASGGDATVVGNGDSGNKNNNGGGTPEPTGNTGAGGGGSGSTNKPSTSSADPAKTEAELLRKAEDELLKITKQAVETRRKVLELSYDRQIEEYKKKLAEDATLTEKSRAAILSIIDSLEKQKAQAIAKFNEDELKVQIEHDSKLIELKLSAVEKGSAEELALKLKLIEDKEKLDLAAAEREYENETEKQEALEAIREKYRKERAQTEEDNKTILIERQREVLRNEIEQLTISETEKQLHRDSWRTMTDEEMEADRTRKLEAIGGYEAQKLQLEEESAQKSYEDLIERGQLSTQTDAEWIAEQNAAKQEWLNKQVAINDAYVKNEQAKQQAVCAVSNGLISLLNALGDENSAYAKMAKVITLAQIAIDTGRALSSGIASASALPFPANMAAIATTVATVLANVATAISTVKSAKFATGGKVTGPGSGTSDSIPAMLSNGEYVMTAKATRLYEPLLAAMNGIGAGVPIQVANSYATIDNAEMMTDGFKEAAKEIKPVVSVVEITETQARVEMIENLDNI